MSSLLVDLIETVMFCLSPDRFSVHLRSNGTFRSPSDFEVRMSASILETCWILLVIPPMNPPASRNHIFQPFDGIPTTNLEVEEPECIRKPPSQLGTPGYIRVLIRVLLLGHYRSLPFCPSQPVPATAASRRRSPHSSARWASPPRSPPTDPWSRSRSRRLQWQGWAAWWAVW